MRSKASSPEEKPPLHSGRPPAVGPDLQPEDYRYMREYALMSATTVLLCSAYFAFGRFDATASHILILGPILLLFASDIRYMTRIEGRPLGRLLPFSLLLFVLSWGLEAAAVRAGLYAYGHSILGTVRFGSVPLLVPCMWVLFCWLAASVVHFLSGGEARGRRPPLIAESLASAAVMTAIALVIEWHFSRSMGLWSWTGQGEGWTIDGVPAVNFLLWFGVGAASPFLQRAVRTPQISYRTEVPILKALPVIGFGVVLAAAMGLNWTKGFRSGALANGISLILLLAAAARREVQVRRTRLSG